MTDSIHITLENCTGFEIPSQYITLEHSGGTKTFKEGKETIYPKFVRCTITKEAFYYNADNYNNPKELLINRLHDRGDICNFYYRHHNGYLVDIHVPYIFNGHPFTSNDFQKVKSKNKDRIIIEICREYPKYIQDIIKKDWSKYHIDVLKNRYSKMDDESDIACYMADYMYSEHEFMV